MPVAAGVWTVTASTWSSVTTLVVADDGGCLVVDPNVTPVELVDLADEVAEHGAPTNLSLAHEHRRAWPGRPAPPGVAGPRRLPPWDPVRTERTEVVAMGTPGAPGTLVLVRHGESTANAAATFTGSRDVGLSAHGIEQSHRAAELMVQAGIVPDLVVTSRMLRAQRTAETMLPVLAAATAGRVVEDLPIRRTWRLNERDYGLLMGMAKTEVRELYGYDQFYSWRRTRHGRPPPVPEGEDTALNLVGVDDDPTDPQTAAMPGRGESLDDVVERVRPLWSRTLAPELVEGHCVLVIGHGNSLRALCAAIDTLDDEELEGLNLPTAQPIVYRVDHAGRATPRGGEYLDPDNAWLEAIRISLEGGT